MQRIIQHSRFCGKKRPLCVGDYRRSRLHVILLLAILGAALTIPTFASDECHGPVSSWFIGKIREALLSQPVHVPTDNRARELALNAQLDSPGQSGRARGAFQGFMIPSSLDGERKGFFLAFPGDAERASTIVDALAPVAATGYDVYVFDYRGILSGPSPTIGELVDDARWLTTHLRSDDRYSTGRHILYGVSAGGIFATQAALLLGSGDLLVLDSVPDNLPFVLICPSSFNPSTAISSVLNHGVRVSILNGALDSKVVPYNSIELIRKARSNHGCSYVLPQGKHPYENGDDTENRGRVISELVAESDCGELH